MAKAAVEENVLTDLTLTKELEDLKKEILEVKLENKRLRALNMKLQEQLLHYMAKPGKHNYLSLYYSTINTGTVLSDIRKKYLFSRSTLNSHAGSVHGCTQGDIIGWPRLFILEFRAWRRIFKSSRISRYLFVENPNLLSQNFITEFDIFLAVVLQKFSMFHREAEATKHRGLLR